MTPMSDAETTVEQLRQRMAGFVAARDWQQFHSPKNLAMALAIEAAELMEHVQWLTIDESRQLAVDPARVQPMAEELADVVCYALAMANALGIDLSDAVRDKMVKNEAKYPAADFRGRYGPEDQGRRTS
jgi:dCTP diphosphatase